MRCSSYCTADEYLLNTASNNFIKLGYKCNYEDRVLHLQRNDVDIFLFTFGCTIIWGASEKLEEEILQDIKSIEKNSIADIHSEFIDFMYNKKGDRTYIDEEKNIINLASDLITIKLSISHALAQSVKLYELEDNVQVLLEETKPLQVELATKGQVSMSKSEISKHIGTLFSTKYNINMHSDILDTPEFFWRRPSFEPIYLMTVEFQDINTRQGILNNHLNLIHELYNMLSDELKHKHSTRIEVVIVMLIAIEVLLAFYKEGLFETIFHYFF